MEQESDQFTVFSWNVQKNIENYAYDVEGSFHILWDYHGNFYIVNDDKVKLIQHECCVKVFQYQSMKYLEDTKSHSDIGYDRGLKFDGKNNNWLIFKEYLSLPFSYMTFVIRDNIENEDPEQEFNEFDLEPYNYVLNKSTCFLDGTFVKNNYEELQHVVRNLEKTDVTLLELLNYTQILEENDQEDEYVPDFLQQNPRS